MGLTEASDDDKQNRNGRRRSSAVGNIADDLEVLE
jgi:hypothetical protein